MTPWTKWYGDLKWAAGFLEGEGSFIHNKDHSIVVTANQKQRQPLEELQRIFGGSIYLWRAKSRSPISVWSLHRIQYSVGLMMTLYPLMSPRRQEQIMKALVAWRSYHYRTHSCMHGHLWTKENTVIYPLKNGKFMKTCVTCKKEWSRTSYERRRLREGKTYIRMRNHKPGDE